MAEEDTGSTPENVEVTDAQVDKFFESGGEEPVAEEKEAEKEAPKIEEKKEEPKEKMVPHQALHEERERRKELQQKMGSMEARFQELVEKLNPKEKIPTIEEDPVTNIDTRIREVERVLTTQNEVQQRQSHENAIVNAYKGAAQEFAKNTPDFGAAYNHYISNRTAELEAMGLNPQEADQQVKQEEFHVAFRCLQTGENPAERLYEAARIRGYAKKEEPPQGAQTSDKRIETITKGQQAAKISSGSSASGKMTLEALSEMDDDEFIKNWDKIVHGS